MCGCSLLKGSATRRSSTSTKPAAPWHESTTSQVASLRKHVPIYFRGEELLLLKGRGEVLLLRIASGEAQDNDAVGRIKEAGDAVAFSPGRRSVVCFSHGYTWLFLYSFFIFSFVSFPKSKNHILCVQRGWRNR